MSLSFKLNKDVDFVQSAWDQTFKHWQEYENRTSLDFLRTLRKNGFRLEFKNLKVDCWMPTITNQVVNLNLCKNFCTNPRIKCFQGKNGEDLTFDIILHKTPPYNIQRIDIDIIEDLGKNDVGITFLNDLMDLADLIGCPLRISDHAQVGTMIPCTLIALINNERARSYPQKNGFKGPAPINKKTRDRIAFWRFQHQNQLMHFINERGKVNKGRIEELCQFFKEHLPNDLRDCVLKISLSEYIRSPYKIKNTSLTDLMK